LEQLRSGDGNKAELLKMGAFILFDLNSNENLYSPDVLERSPLPEDRESSAAANEPKRLDRDTLGA
jgi:hypothetical protein